MTMRPSIMKWLRPSLASLCLWTAVVVGRAQDHAEEQSAQRFLLAIGKLHDTSLTAARSPYEAPKQIGALAYDSAGRYEDPALGEYMTFKGDGATRTTYRYSGTSPPPPGINSEVFKTHFTTVQSDIIASWPVVRFVDDATVSIRDRDLTFRRGRYEIFDGTTWNTSVLFLTAARNRYYKARLTVKNGSPFGQAKQLANIERDLYAFMARWMAE